MRVEISEKFFVERVDNRNWSIFENIEVKEKNGTIVVKAKNLERYAPTMKEALHMAVDVLPNEVDKKSDIVKILKQIAKTAKAINEIK